MASTALDRPKSKKKTASQIVKEAKKKLAKMGGTGAAKGAKELARAAGGKLRKAGAAGKGFVQRNWKTALFHEGTGAVSHGVGAIADIKTRKLISKLPMILRPLVRPTTIGMGLGLGGMLLTKGSARAWFRELLRGLGHAKEGQAIAMLFGTGETEESAPPRREAAKGTEGEDDAGEAGEAEGTEGAGSSED